MIYKEYTLDNLTLNITDGTHSTVKNNSDGKCYLLSAKNIKNGKIIYDEFDRRINSVTLNMLRLRTKTEYNDVLITTVGTIGEVAQITETNPLYEFQRSVAILKPNELIVNPSYFKYLLNNAEFKKKAISHSSGSVQKCLFLNIIKKIKVIINENIVEQKAIANILSSLDDKIELNNKINKNLEDLALTLYKRWFVDFEFPNENGEPYKYFGGEMVESELGFIPKIWGTTAIGDICDTVLGGTPSRKVEKYWNGDINWINSGEINQFRIINPSELITKDGLNNSSTKMMPKKTTVIAITGATLGAVSLLEIDSCANQSVIGILQNDDFPYSFIYPTIMNQISDIIGRQTGGAQQHINKNDVNSFKIILPDRQTLKNFHSTIDALYNEISNRVFQNDKLSQLRDELLPKLMNGEIEVPIKE